MPYEPTHSVPVATLAKENWVVPELGKWPIGTIFYEPVVRLGGQVFLIEWKVLDNDPASGVGYELSCGPQPWQHWIWEDDAMPLYPDRGKAYFSLVGALKAALKTVWRRLEVCGWTGSQSAFNESDL